MKKLLPVLAVLLAIGASPVVSAQVAITPEAAAELAFMREEEKLAHDVYAWFDAFFAEREPGANVFGRIAASEARHTEAVLNLLVAYGLPDPAYAEAGKFLDPGLQALYDSLVATGELGVTEALTVGVVIEQTDITDIGEAIEVSLAYPDIMQVYSNLLAASENHLAAFNKVLARGSL
jgi:hypothetical protein